MNGGRGSSDYKRVKNGQAEEAKGNKPSWEGQCIHIVVELAECGDV